MRLIDKDELYTRLGSEKSTKSVPCYVAEAIEKCEVVDPVKHGRWTPEHRYDDEEYYSGEYDKFVCSECGYEVEFEEAWSFNDYVQIYKPNYCNCCGAKMEV